MYPPMPYCRRNDVGERACEVKVHVEMPIPFAGRDRPSAAEAALVLFNSWARIDHPSDEDLSLGTPGIRALSKKELQLETSLQMKFPGRPRVSPCDSAQAHPPDSCQSRVVHGGGTRKCEGRRVAPLESLTE